MLASHDGYAARDILNYPGCGALLSKQETRDLVHLIDQSGLSRKHLSAQFRAQLIAALASWPTGGEPLMFVAVRARRLPATACAKEAGKTLTARGKRREPMKPGFALSEIDTTTPHPARMYNAYLGGKDTYPADREAVRHVLRRFPEVRGIARANRAFLQRAARYLVGEAGVRQIIDVGTGIPRAGNVHEVAGQIAPDTRVVCADKDRWAASVNIFGVSRRPGAGPCDVSGR